MDMCSDPFHNLCPGAVNLAVPEGTRNSISETISMK